jgi:glycerophosphoryl diester phosphodiesterase
MTVRSTAADRTSRVNVDMQQMAAEHASRAPHLVAHRGIPASMPGNTLIGFEAALQAGARYLELDIQLTADGVPVLYHDADTLRMSGVAGGLLTRSLAEVKKLRASYPSRFGNRFKDNPVPSLFEFCELLTQWPEVTVFVELKRASLNHFGRANMVDAAVKVLRAFRDQVVVISFDVAATEYAGSTHGVRVGWVLPEWSAENQARAEALTPHYLFCDMKILPKYDHHIWCGPWQWAVYVVDDPHQALGLSARGIDLVETDRIVEMLQHPLLAERARHG